MNLGIIGTAGRQGRHALMSASTFEQMIEQAEAHIADIKRLVSGGSAWADHTAVVLALDHNIPLTLHLPCKWDEGEFDNGTYCGRTLNHLHKLMKERTGQDPLQELDDALKKPGTIVTVASGPGYEPFFTRNKLVARDSNVLVAFGLQNKPMTGGTRHTWNLCAGEKFYYHVT